MSETEVVCLPQASLDALPGLICTVHFLEGRLGVKIHCDMVRSVHILSTPSYMSFLGVSLSRVGDKMMMVCMVSS